VSRLLNIRTWLNLQGVGPRRAISHWQNESKPQASAQEFKKAEELARRELDYCRQENIIPVDYFDERYPARLKEISSPPAIIYLKGDIDCLKKEQAAAVVGTRQPSSFGTGATSLISHALSKAGFTIVSGLALGVDALSHQAALDCNQATIAVLGSGLDIVTPTSHRQLAEEITEKGLLLSEQAPGSAAKPYTLVARNRLQSALSALTVAVESRVKGGTMHTTKFAIEQGKPLFCPVNQKGVSPSQGMQYLLEKEAKLLPQLIPAWSSAAKLVENRSGPVAQAISSSQLDVFISDALQIAAAK
jgi:DNA processing protein